MNRRSFIKRFALAVGGAATAPAAILAPKLAQFSCVMPPIKTFTLKNETVEMPFWFQTSRISLCVSREYEEWLERAMQQNRSSIGKAYTI